jgi:hypothetical protein
MTIGGAYSAENVVRFYPKVRSANMRKQNDLPAQAAALAARRPSAETSKSFGEEPDRFSRNQGSNVSSNKLGAYFSAAAAR